MDQAPSTLAVPTTRSRATSEEPDAPWPEASHVLSVARTVLTCVVNGDHLLDQPITLSCGHSLCSSCLAGIRATSRSQRKAEGVEDSAIEVPTGESEPTATIFTTETADGQVNPADRCLCPIESCRSACLARPSIVPGREPRVDVVLKKTLEHVKAVKDDRLDDSFVGKILEDLDCHICAQLYHRPISLNCGHSFCAQCFTRAQDHSPTCPLCRTQLPGPAFFTAHPRSHALSELIRLAFGSLWAQREAQDLKAQREESSRVPIFVCSLSLPGQPTPLHVFEPRYRLMMRRAMDQDRQFGMVLHARTSSGLHSHGTMLRIRNLQLLSDGRSLVDTVGMWRFKVASVGVLDGYCVGEVERLDDNSLEEEAALEQAAVNADPPEPSTGTYISILQAFIETIQSNAPPMQVRRMHQAFGPVPLEATALTFYAAQLLPQPDSVKAVLLEMNSPRQRAKTVVGWIAEMRQQNGSRCPIM